MRFDNILNPRKRRFRMLDKNYLAKNIFRKNIDNKIEKKSECILIFEEEIVCDNIFDYHVKYYISLYDDSGDDILKDKNNFLFFVYNLIKDEAIKIYDLELNDFYFQDKYIGAEFSIKYKF